MDPSLDVLVIDKFPASAQGNTGKSAAMFRNVFASSTNRKLTNASIEFFKHVQEDLGVDLDLHFTGYLWLFDKERYEKLKHVINKMVNENLEIEVISKDELKSKLGKWLVFEFSEDDEDAQLLNLKNIDHGVLGKKCGSINPDFLVKFYEEEFKKMGGRVLYRTKVERLILEPKDPETDLIGKILVWHEPVIKGVVTDKGEEIRAKFTILATGAWINELLDPIGIDSHTKSKKRQLFHLQHERLKELLEVKGFNEEGCMPFIILPKAGIYIKPLPHENSVWIGCGDNIGREFVNTCSERAESKCDLDDPKAEEEYYEYSVYYVLSKYLPIVENLRPKNMWAGYYNYNTLDKNPYVFKPDGVEGLMVVIGGSGSGIMKADSVGIIAAGLYFGKETVTLFDGTEFKVSDLGVKNRNVEKEVFII